MVPVPRCKKVTYSTKEEAEKFLLEFQISRNFARREKRSYKCPKCGYWHLTSQRKEGKLSKPLDKENVFTDKEKEWLEVIMQVKWIFSDWPKS